MTASLHTHFLVLIQALLVTIVLKKFTVQKLPVPTVISNFKVQKHCLIWKVTCCLLKIAEGL